MYITNTPSLLHRLLIRVNSRTSMNLSWMRNRPFAVFLVISCIFIALYTRTFLIARKADPHLLMTTASSSKRGLSWDSNNKDPTFLFTKPNSKISWLYNWSPNPTPGSSIPFVPMQWNDMDVENLQRKIIAHGKPSFQHILGFNEPERSDQANMTSQQAAQVWIRHFEPLRRLGIRCGSPGPSSAPEGVAWLESFLTHIREGGSDIDFYAIHWYGETLGQFYDYIWSTYHRLGPNKPVWITEYAPTNWRTDVGTSLVQYLNFDLLFFPFFLYLCHINKASNEVNSHHFRKNTWKSF